MSDKIKDIDEPMNAHERYMYATVIRLDALCNMLSSLIEHIAKRDGVATTTNEEVKVEPKQCKGKTNKGNRCKRTVEEGSEFCPSHKE